MSSHDVVHAVRKITGEKRVGHAGTLDPYARGVLVIGVGRAATKKLRFVAGAEKEYITRIRLGWRSTTDDREGVLTQTTECGVWSLESGRASAGSGPPSEEQVRQALAGFQGLIDQRPPVFSAIKVHGRPAYKRARAERRRQSREDGADHPPFVLPPRRVEVKEIELLRYAWPHVDVRLVTGAGFYVRSFARDLGEALGTGGYMAELERIRIGPYTKEQATRLPDLAKSLDNTVEGEQAGIA